MRSFFVGLVACVVWFHAWAGSAATCESLASFEDANFVCAAP